MSQTLRARYNGEYEDRIFAESPFFDARAAETEAEAMPSAETIGEAPSGPWHFEGPFAAGEAPVGEAATPEIAALSEIASELKDPLFRESLEQLADEALDAHAAQLGGEYGDRETRDLAAERLLTEHFNPLANEADAMLQRFFERLEGYEAETLSETEIERVAGEVLSTDTPRSPAAEQFLGGLLRKAGKLVSGAVNLAKRGVQGAISLAGKGLSAIGKLVLGPLLKPLKALGKFLLKHVVRFAIGQLPPALQPIARRLSDRLFQAIGETHEGEFEDHEQSEAEALPAAADAARLEAEFDVQAAQLLLTPDEAEAEHLVESYGEVEPSRPSLADLDATRAQLGRELQALEPGASAQPMMEQFVPAILWPAAKTAITLIGRPKLVRLLGNLLGGLIRPMIGQQATSLLAPAIADAGLRIFGLETQPDPRAVATEALAATVEETVNSLAAMPPHVFENETVFESAVRDAFETAAATYYPSAVIKPELRETEDARGMWTRMPAGSSRARYARYSQAQPVTITPQAARHVRTFHGATLHDHLRDHMGVPVGRPLKTQVRLYQALPGTRASAIARAEGFRAHDLHPLTPHAAGVLLGPNAALGRHTPADYLNSPHQLHVGQRLYFLEPPGGRHHRPHVRLARTEMAINLRAGEIRLWLYLSEPLCQQVSAELARGGNATGGFRLLRPLIHRATETLRSLLLHRRLPPSLRVVSEAPNLENLVPPWLENASRPLAAKIAEWASEHVAQYLRGNAQEFRNVCASRHDGVTLRVTMSRVPGLETLRLAARERNPRTLAGTAWLRGAPSFAVSALPGYAIR